MPASELHAGPRGQDPPAWCGRQCRLLTIGLLSFPQALHTTDFRVWNLVTWDLCKQMSRQSSVRHSRHSGDTATGRAAPARHAAAGRSPRSWSSPARPAGQQHTYVCSETSVCRRASGLRGCLRPTTDCTEDPPAGDVIASVPAGSKTAGRQSDAAGSAGTGDLPSRPSVGSFPGAESVAPGRLHGLQT